MLTHINRWRLKRKCKAHLEKEYPVFYELWKDKIIIEPLKTYAESCVWGEYHTYMRMLKDKFGKKALYFLDRTPRLISYPPFLGNVKFNVLHIAYKVCSKEGDIQMAALPNYLAKFIVEPPTEIMERQENSLHLFLDALKQFKPDSGEICLNNNIAYLLNQNLCSHPKVHRGYYESKHKGVLFVKDCSTGESIRKDESILLPTGEFIKSTSPRVIKTISPTQKDLLFNVLSGNEAALAAFEGSFFYEQEHQICIPFSVDLFKKAINPKRVCDAFFNEYIGIITTLNVLVNPEDLTDVPLAVVKPLLQDKLKTSAIVKDLTSVMMYFPESDTHRYRGFLMPDDSPFFAGWLFYDNDSFGDNMRHALREGQIPAIYLNHRTGIKWNTNAGMGAAMILPNEFSGNFPFNFAIMCQRAAQVTQNKKSANNDGQLLSHNANVMELKVAFLMMPEEKVLFDRYNLEHKAALKEHVLKGGTKPVKHPSQEPIYLGLELEVTAKGAARTTIGVKQIIKQIADSSFGDHAITKHDGSIGDYGMEIVTVPATLAYHKDMLEKHFFGEPNMLHKNLMVTDACGLHVHIAKNAFTPLDIGKFMSFINSNANKAFVDAMANRAPNMYCLKQTMAGENALGVDISAKIGLTACRENSVRKGLNFTTLPRENLTRRRAINLQNAHTLEVRSFKSSTDKNNVLRKMEFCESLLKFVRNSSPQQMTSYDYVNFLLDKANKASYPYLIRWLASKGYIDHDRRMVKYLDKEEKKTRNKLVHVYNNNKIQNPHKPPTKKEAL